MSSRKKDNQTPRKRYSLAEDAVLCWAGVHRSHTTDVAKVTLPLLAQGSYHFGAQLMRVVNVSEKEMERAPFFRRVKFVYPASDLFSYAASILNSVALATGLNLPFSRFNSTKP